MCPWWPLTRSFVLIAKASDDVDEVMQRDHGAIGEYLLPTTTSRAVVRRANAVGASQREPSGSVK
jgi:hypothetical protein